MSDDDAILWEAFDSAHMLKVGAITREKGRIVLWSGAQRVYTSPEAADPPALAADPPALRNAVAMAHRRTGREPRHDRGWSWACYCPTCCELRRLADREELPELDDLDVPSGGPA